MNDFFQEHVIECQFSRHYTLQHNGIIDCGIYFNMQELFNVFWHNIINTVVYVLNQAPTLTLKDTTL